MSGDDISRRLDDQARRAEALEAAVKALQSGSGGTASGLADLRKDLAAIGKRVDAMQAGTASEDTAALRRTIDALLGERVKLSEQVRRLSETTRQASPATLAEGFRQAAIALQAGLAPRPGDAAAFGIVDLQVGLKALLAIGDDGALRFVLPAPGEVPEAAALTDLRFTLRAQPEAAPTRVGELLPVPSLLGLSRASAESRLGQAGLGVGSIAEAESASLPGTVIGQSPEPGVEAAPEVRVDLLLALPRRTAVPDLAGLSAMEAEAALAAAGLLPGRQDEAVATTAPRGTIVAQDPAAGTMVPLGAAVGITLATAAPERVVVPDIVGLARAEAEARLGAARLALAPITDRAAAKEGLVLAQDPAAGTPVAPGSAVSVRLGPGADLPVLIDRAVKAAAGTRTGISGTLLRQRLTQLALPDAAAFAALAVASDDALQAVIGAPTPRGLADARAALRKALADD
ncbi:PASTA domain-containing protein [Roseomonas sp. CAU 1739]|uniref:PASTA domain-containing protein n=1 Tax=Roseomonas sp. CAU 1739 TaxID=3140364 RepID=UPI00325B768C